MYQVKGDDIALKNPSSLLYFYFQNTWWLKHRSEIPLAPLTSFFHYFYRFAAIKISTTKVYVAALISNTQTADHQSNVKSNFW